jgi:hypothetical protein
LVDFAQTDAFYSTSGAIVFSVTNLVNPRSLKVSSSFQVFTYDSRGFMIEYKLDQMAATMDTTLPVVSALVSPSMTVVGGTA